MANTALSPSPSPSPDTVPSPTLRSITQRGIQQLKFTADPKVSNSARSRTQCSITLRGVLPGTFLSLQAAPCLQ